MVVKSYEAINRLRQAAQAASMPIPSMLSYTLIQVRDCVACCWFDVCCSPTCCCFGARNLLLHTAWLLISTQGNSLALLNALPAQLLVQIL